MNGAGHWWRWDSGNRMRAQEFLHVHFVALPAHLERNLIGITALVEYHQNAVEAVRPRTQGHRETGQLLVRLSPALLKPSSRRWPRPRPESRRPVRRPRIRPPPGFARPRIRRPQVAGGGFPVWLRAWPRRSPGPGGVGRGIAAVVTPAADPEWSPSNRTEENAVRRADDGPVKFIRTLLSPLCHPTAEGGRLAIDVLSCHLRRESALFHR